MPKVPIKKGSFKRQISDDLKVNLREAESVFDPRKQPSLPSKRKRLFFSIFLFVIVALSVFSWWLYSSQKIPLVDFIPENAVAWGLINHQELYPQISPFGQFLADNNFYGQRAINKLDGYFDRAGLDFGQDVQPFLKKQAAFVLMPVNSETSFPFALILEKNNLSGDFSQFLSQIEPELKKDYNFSSYIYRQIKVSVLKPLFSEVPGLPRIYAFAQIEDYFILSDSQECLEKIIDLIIKK